MIKDIGMIPYYFHKMYNFNGKILTYKIGEYPFLKKYCRGLKLEFVKQSRKFNGFGKISERNVLKYLIFNAKKIDILNLIHPRKANVRYGVLYKLFNKNGFIYLKMDVDESFKRIDLYRWQHSKKVPYKGILNFLDYQIKKRLNKNFFEVIDLISVESRDMFKFFKIKYPQLRNKLIYLPNGVDNIYIKEAGITRLPFSEKENIILTVGRIGLEAKSNETLLEAVSKIKNLKDWKVILIGPIEKRFIKYTKDFFKKYPDLKNNFFFTGEITNRKKLFEYYQKSKIFCLTSKTESFGIVLVEAGYFGNFIVSTDLLPAKDITMNGKLGRLFNIGDSDELASILEELINSEQLLKENYFKIQKHIENNFLWRKIIPKLYKEIIKRWKK